MGRRFDIPVPSEQMQGKGILMVELAGMEKLRGVERGRLLAPRMVRRFLMLKRLSMAEMVVVLGEK